MERKLVRYNVPMHELIYPRTDYLSLTQITPAFVPGITDDIKRAIVIDVARNSLSTKQIAERYKISPQYVSTIWRQFNQGRDEVVEDEDKQIRVELKERAVVAVKAGLEHKQDPYKRGSLGVQVLKGVRVLDDPSVQIKINNIMTRIPEDWKDRYVGNSLLESEAANDGDK